uniref:Uncharacterized protein n=1 Tax=Fagus sylvatica TaxID=28930 RepID=A0A2N9IWK2_FAGSY
MDKVYEELDDAKAEIEKLKAEYKSKAELCENLKKAHNEQLIKLQEGSLKIEKQSQELNEKTQENSEVKQMCEELKHSFNEKESIIKRLSAANDKLRADYDEKSLKWEKENRDLMLALDEANEKIMDQEQNIRAHKEEIEGLKGCLSVSQKKCSEAEKRAKASKEVRKRDDMLLNLEDENRKLEDQLKWKKEHFTHLEEAHEKLKNQFRASKKEWEQEKSTLLDEICSLQTSLDSQTRMSEDLKNRLQMCNQALAHEETRRKYLEVQVSEFQTRFENAFAESQDARSLLERLTTDRDKEISALRHSLGTKEAIYKEMKYQAGKLEQENQELRISLRELQEAQIQESGASSSLAKLRNKLKSLEQMHRESTVNLRAKEAGLSSQLEKMGAELNDCRSELENKDAAIKALMMEFEGCQSLAMQLKLENEEISVMLLVLKLGISEAQLKLASEKAEMDVRDKEREEKVSFLMKQLEMKNAALSEAQLKLTKEKDELHVSTKEREDNVSLLLKQLEMKNAALSEAQLKLAKEKAEMDVRDKEREEKVSFLMKQLEMKNAALSEAQLKLTKEKDELHVSTKEREDNVSLLLKQLEMKNAALSEAQLKLAKEKAEMDVRDKEREEKVSFLMKQLEMKNAALSEAQLKLAKEMDELHVSNKEGEDNVSLLMKQLEIKNAALSEAQLKLAKEKAELDVSAKEREDNVSSLMKQLEMKNAALSEAQLKLEKEKAELDVSAKEREDNVSLLMKQLEMKNAVLSEAQLKLAKEKAELDVSAKEKEDNFSLLVKQLEMKNAALSEAQVKLAKEKAELDVSAKAREDNVSLLVKQLEMKNAALVRAQTDIIEEREKAESLLRRVESLEIIEEQQLLMRKELERYKEMLEESSRCQLLLKEQVLQIESSSKEKITEVCDALVRANTELAEKICEGNEIEFELQIWKSIAERLKVDLEENHEVRKELEASLLAQVDVGETTKQEKNGLIQMLEEKDRRMDNLQQQILLQEQDFKKRETEAASFSGMETMSFESEKASFFQTSREKDKILEKLEKEVGWLEQESLRREFESAILSQIVAERTFEHEKEKLIHLLEEKNQKIDDLMQLLKSLEQKFNSSLISFSSQLAEKQAEINLVKEACERITAAEILAVLEIEEKKLMIGVLEDDICNIQQKLELQERSLCYSRQQALKIEAELDAKQLEMKNLTTQMETKLRTSDALVNELKSEKRSLLEDVMKLSTERENLLDFITGLGDRISELSAADSQLMGVLSTMVHSFDNNSSEMVLKEDDEPFQSVKENLNIHSSPATKKFEAISDARPPFRERNS